MNENEVIELGIDISGAEMAIEDVMAGIGELKNLLKDIGTAKGTRGRFSCPFFFCKKVVRRLPRRLRLLAMTCVWGSVSANEEQNYKVGKKREDFCENGSYNEVG